MSTAFSRIYWARQCDQTMNRTNCYFESVATCIHKAPRCVLMSLLRRGESRACRLPTWANIDYPAGEVQASKQMFYSSYTHEDEWTAQPHLQLFRADSLMHDLRKCSSLRPRTPFYRRPMTPTSTSSSGYCRRGNPECAGSAQHQQHRE